MELVFAKIKPFDGKNFDSWKYRVENFLEAQGVLDVLSSVKPGESAAAAALATWNEKNAKAKNLVISLVDDNHLEFIKGKATAKEMWDSLNAVFSGTNMAKQNMLRTRLDRLRYELGSDMKIHFTKFDECIRELSAAGAKVEPNECIYYLFKSFPEEFQPLITALENLPDETLTLDYAKSRLLNEEMRQQTIKDSNGAREHVAYAASFGGECFLCKKRGHKKFECPQNKSKNKSKKRGKQQKKQGEQANKNEQESSAIAFVLDSGRVKPNVWYLDSGSTRHATNNLALLSNVKQLQKPLDINTAEEGGKIKATHVGVYRGHTLVDGERKDVVMEGVYYSKQLRANLLSLRLLHEKGLQLLFIEDCKVMIKAKGETVAYAKLSNGMYEVELYAANESIYFSDADKLWHRRLGHINKEYLKQMKDDNMVTGLSEKQEKVDCESCIKGKQAELPYKKQRPKTSRILERVHTDVCGPITPASHDGYKYFVSFIDDYSHFACVYLIKQKSDVFATFQKYEKAVTTKFNSKIAHLRCDQGREYLSNEQLKYYEENGIELETTVGYCPKQNGVAERFNRSVVEKARTMLIESGMKKYMWGEAVLTATY